MCLILQKASWVFEPGIRQPFQIYRRTGKTPSASAAIPPQKAAAPHPHKKGGAGCRSPRRNLRVFFFAVLRRWAIAEANLGKKEAELTADRGTWGFSRGFAAPLPNGFGEAARDIAAMFYQTMDLQYLGSILNATASHAAGCVCRLAALAAPSRLRASQPSTSRWRRQR
jgi:hypothetical protein